MSQVRQVMQRGKVQYGLQRFIVDTPDDLLKLPAKTVPGSSAYVISTGATYIHNSENVWVKVKSTSNGSTSGGNNSGSNSGNNNGNCNCNCSIPGMDDVWDGGDIDNETSFDDMIIWDGGGIEGPADTPSGDETTNGGEI
jgi:hypothetical protein